MKNWIKICSITLALMLFSGCGNDGFLSEHNTKTQKLINNYELIEIEDSQYIFYSRTDGYSGRGFLAHKGNCSNTIHKCK